MKDISSIFPTFLGGMTFVPTRTDPPDFIGESEGGQKVGVELTSWLNRDQVSAARGRERMREDLLKIIEWERHPHPKYISSAIIMPRWGNPIRKTHYRRLCNEFHAAVHHIDNTWATLRVDIGGRCRKEKGLIMRRTKVTSSAFKH